jgi:hypothetical protein
MDIVQGHSTYTVLSTLFNLAAIVLVVYIMVKIVKRKR